MRTSRLSLSAFDVRGELSGTLSLFLSGIAVKSKSSGNELEVKYVKVKSW